MDPTEPLTACTVECLPRALDGVVITVHRWGVADLSGPIRDGVPLSTCVGRAAEAMHECLTDTAFGQISHVAIEQQPPPWRAGARMANLSYGLLGLFTGAAIDAPPPKPQVSFQHALSKTKLCSQLPVGTYSERKRAAVAVVGALLALEDTVVDTTGDTAHWRGKWAEWLSTTKADDPADALLHAVAKGLTLPPRARVLGVDVGLRTLSWCVLECDFDPLLAAVVPDTETPAAGNRTRPRESLLDK
jgi:hypothetical protein